VAGGERPAGVELFDSFVERPDLDELDAWLAAADEEQGRWARTWLRTHHVALREVRPGEAEEVRRARRWASTLIVASCAPPGEAAKQLEWNDFWILRLHGTRERVGRALCRRPRGWAEAFVPRAAEVRLARLHEPETAPVLFRLLDELIRQHGLPLPDGDAFLHGWARTRDDRYLADLLPALFRSSHLRHRPGIAATLEAKIATGEIARSDVVAAALEGLVVHLRPSAQKVLAEVLVWLELTPEELAGKLPLLQNALGTAHGSVTAVVLPLAMSEVTAPADLTQISTVVAGRAEKRQRATLLTLLQAPGLRERVGVDAVLAALALLGECDDAALRERVARATRTITGASESETTEDLGPSVPWAPFERRRPSAERLRPLPQLSHSNVRWYLDPWRSGQNPRAYDMYGRVGHAVLLEHIVRSAAADRDAARASLPPHDGDGWPSSWRPVPAAIICWLRGDLDEGPLYDDGMRPSSAAHRSSPWRPRDHVLNAAAREVLWRAGRVATVLSTPSLSDGTLELEVLLHRIVTSPGRDLTYTPYDLALALLRMRPVRERNAARLERLGPGLVLPADPACWAQHVRLRGRPGGPSPDGIELIRRWVREGGLRPGDVPWRLVPRPDSTNAVWWDRGGVEPLPVGVLDDLLVRTPGLLEVTGYSQDASIVALEPWWTDLAAASLGPGCTKDHHRLSPDVVLEATGPVGTPAHALVLARLAGVPDQHRDAVLALLELVRRDALSPTHFRRAVEELNQAGALPFTRLAHGLEQAFDEGALADLWEVAVGVTADAARRRPLPSGLPALLRMLAAYLPSVPDAHRGLPAELVELANARGTSKSHAEARALLAVREAS
jgi:hypothetical protein